MGRHHSLTGRIFVICAGTLLAASSTGQHMEPGTEPASAFEGIEDIDEDTDMNANQQNDLAAAHTRRLDGFATKDCSDDRRKW